ncbi:unnamed protein product [Rhodiola kirilowii]
MFFIDIASAVATKNLVRNNTVEITYDGPNAAPAIPRSEISKDVFSGVSGAFGGNDGCQNATKEADLVHSNADISYSSEVEISAEIAQKFSSYDGCLFNCEKADGLVDARTIFMHFRADYEDDESFFRTLDESVRNAE